MKILFTSIVFILQIWIAQGANNFATCKRAWTKIGCYHDGRKPSRALPEMLLNDRDRSSKYHQKGFILNWHKWEESIHSLACRCAERALQKGYRVFGLQFYGECWSGPFAEFNYSRDGKSKRCIMNLYNPTDCVQGQERECVGKKNTNYIYKLTANPGPQSPDVDGGYTPWSQWSACSKTCGPGFKSRERTCTNPKPAGNGLPCSPRLGEPEETARCYHGICHDCDKVMDVGVVVDSSSSVRRDNYETVKKFLINLVDQMHVSQRMTHVGIIHYNHRAYLDWDFSSNRAQNAAALKKAIMDLKYQPGGTRTDLGMGLASNEMFKVAHGERPNVPHVLLVITDGKTSRRSKKYKDVLQPFMDKGVKVIAIGVGLSVDNEELKKIANLKPENVVHVENFGKLVSKIKDILKLSCKKRKLFGSVA